MSSGTASAPSLPSSLPSAKPTFPPYPSGTKFHSSHTAVVAGGEAQYNSSHAKGGPQESDAQSQDSTVQFPRHRAHRRTKDQETLSKSGGGGNPLPSIRESAPAGNAQHNRGVQFDLEASAFPPLPGLDADSKPRATAIENSVAESQSHNRLSDVVKGTAKLKSTKEKDPVPGLPPAQCQQLTSNSSRSASPGSSADGAAASGTSASATASNLPASSSDTADVALSTVTLTPPSSPDK